MNLLTDKCYLKVKEEILRPNIFNILSLEYYEIRHSNFLAWLLDSNESHACGSLFSSVLLKILFPKSSINNVDFSIYRERENVDLLLESPSEVLVLENKIRAKDHENQLSGYRSHIQAKYPMHSKSFSYLTPKGEEPIDKDEAKHWSMVSYEKLIDALKETINANRSSLDKRIQIYIDDYIFSMQVRILRNHRVNEISRKLCERYKDDLLEYVNEFEKKGEDRSDKLTMNFIASHAINKKGQGFFRKEAKWVHAFRNAFEKHQFIVPPVSGNSTYFSYTTSGLCDVFGGSESLHPFAFSIRFYSGRNVLRWSAGIGPVAEDLHGYREILIRCRHQITNEYPELTVNSRGRNHIGIIGKTVPMVPEDFAGDNLSKQLENFVELHFLSISNHVSDIVNDIIRRS